MLPTILGFLLATGSFLSPNTINQLLVDNNPWLYMDNLSNQKGCNSVRLITAHNFKPLWAAITNLQIGKKLTFQWCRYEVVNYTIEETKTFDKRKLQNKNATLRMQTCFGDDNEFALIVELKATGQTRKLIYKK